MEKKKSFINITKEFSPFLFIFCTVIFFSFLTYLFIRDTNLFSTSNPNLKLYWFIPDGVRAEPDLFTIYKWAEEGKLPNIKKLMEMGTYGYSKPTFPSHTPTNFATLLTGSYPEVHGIDDGTMRILGKPLDKVAIGGFRSTAKKVPPIWTTLEKNGYKVALLSMPGSTPPELNNGIVLRGRWGGWGADFFAVNFESEGNLSQRIKQANSTKQFYFGPQLTQYIRSKTPTGWDNPPISYSDEVEIEMDSWGTKVYGYMIDTTDDDKKNYDKVAFSLDKKKILASLTQGVWSDWKPITLQWKNQAIGIPVDTQFKAVVIKLDGNGFFRIRLFYNNLNKYISQPEDAATKMLQSIGPMVDFVDNFPPQLIYYPEDKQIFLDEAQMSLDWHKKAVGSMGNNFKPDAIIHDTYTPNQMLTSRWWLGHVDPHSVHYEEVSATQRKQRWSEVKDMYKKLDDIVGEILKSANKNTYIVFSSDHGAAPLNRSVHLNNLFAQKGWLSFSIDSKTGESSIDWKNSKVVFLQMASIYINPHGLDGDYIRASDQQYEELRNQVIEALKSLTDENGQKPVADIVKWENAKDYMKLDPTRIGDLVIANQAGYGWSEDMTSSLSIFSSPLVSGYKQAINPNTSSVWTPFLIAGPSIKKNNFLGNIPISHIDQYPTIMKALNIEIPSFVQGKKLDIFK